MQTLTSPAEHEETIKRSRFRARVWPCVDKGRAETLLARVRAEDASHHCWAWRIGDAYRFDDDGEPAGTAGRPIQQALDHHDLDQVLVVVTRWFGGIKLGAGGLVRAYGGVAGRCLDSAPKRQLIEHTTVTLETDFGGVGVMHDLLDRYGAEKVDEAWTDSGARLTVKLACSRLDELRNALIDATRGKAVIKVNDDRPD